MEIQNLVTQLNSACEDYLGAPQANGFPAEDELHLGNCCEPGFHAIRQNGRVYEEGEQNSASNISKMLCSATISAKVGVENREICIRETIKNVFDKDQRYELNEFGETKTHAKSFEDVVIDDSTLFDFFEKPKDQDRRRSWTFILCNCNDWKSKRPSSGTSLCNNWQGKSAGSKKTCRKFEISWKSDLNLKNAKNAAGILWYAFEVAPDVDNVGSLTFLQGFKGRFQGRFEAQNYDMENPSDFGKYTKEEFNPVWTKISKSKGARGGSETAGDSDEASDQEQSESSANQSDEDWKPKKKRKSTKKSKKFILSDSDSICYIIRL
eukprot:GHVP01030288.1.p1 GENE.GHVP01030288.1~~GHVP01030288.1.p1  ORF type:complete len:323 (-),score=59.25 GHVP01030288.1:1604-2572(-)